MWDIKEDILRNVSVFCFVFPQNENHWAPILLGLTFFKISSIKFHRNEGE